MNYIVSEDQIDSILKRYFDKLFSNAKFLENIRGTSEYIWSGFFRNGITNIENMIIGTAIDQPNVWFTNGDIFNSVIDVFDLSTKDFNDAIKRYLNKNHNTNIDLIL